MQADRSQTGARIAEAARGHALGLLSRSYAFARVRSERRLRFHSAYRFEDRRRHRDGMLIVLAGFKEYLWPTTLRRLERFVPEDIDVCIVSAGVHREGLADSARRMGWSYLASETRRLSTAQNIAIELHPSADWIWKVDEDMVVGEGLFERMREGYRAIEARGEHVPGVVSPIVNVNGFSYRPFLERIGAVEEYRAAFGTLASAGAGIPIQNDGAAARWVWERSLPFDELAARFAAAPFGYAPVPHRFSIGVILFRRALWADMGGFLAMFVGPGIGADEAHLCMHCVDNSQIVAVLDNALAGHWCFGPQEAAMRPAYDELRDALEPRPAMSV